MMARPSTSTAIPKRSNLLIIVLLIASPNRSRSFALRPSNTYAHIKRSQSPPTRPSSGDDHVPISRFASRTETDVPDGYISNTRTGTGTSASSPILAASSSSSSSRSTTRRSFFAETGGRCVSTSFLLLTSLLQFDHARADDSIELEDGTLGITTDDVPMEKKVFVRGVVSLPSSISLPPPPSSSSSSSPIAEDTATTTPKGPALYITARPNVVDDVPRAILDGSRGKPPPVLTKRVDLSTGTVEFPLEFGLGSDDLTMEGRAVVAAGTTGSGGGGKERWWWEGMDLVVSARYDTDGMAYTRDPTDLVGRGLWSAKNDGDGGGVKVSLQGRGWTGKLVTGRSK